MYFIYCLLLWSLVYTFPALALTPRLICSPRTAFAIPILSVFVIYCLSSLLIILQVFSAISVIVTASMLTLIALWQIRKVVTTQKFHWSKSTLFIYLFHLVVLFPYFIKLGTHAFDRGDEIYSWNFWAIQHYFLESIDFSHTGAPYPQLFPKLLAFSYHLLGSIDLQLPVKATLVIFPWSMLTAIAMSYRRPLLPYFGAYLLLLAWVLMGAGLEQFFNDGYADPLMTSCLMVSAALFWLSQQPAGYLMPRFLSPNYYALLAVICAITAAHTKQAALLWTLFSLPCLLWLVAKKQSHPHYFRLLGLVCFLGGLVWLLGEGRNFHHNHGVLWLSLGERDIFSQFLYAAEKYFIHKPLLFLLFATATIVSWKKPLLRYMVGLFFIPSLFCWFFFGAYQLRLGQHLIAFAFFIIMANGKLLPASWRRHPRWQSFLIWWPLSQRWIFLASLGLSLVVGTLLFVKEVWVEKSGISLYAGGRHSLQRYFADDADYIYQAIYRDPHTLLWVPSRYLYGLFYHHTRLTTPDYQNYKNYNQSALVEELQRKSPDYVFTVSPDIVDGPASGLLSSIVEQCPQAFVKVSSPDGKFGFITYKVLKPELQQDPCLLAFLNPQTLPKDEVAYSE